MCSRALSYINYKSGICPNHEHEGKDVIFRIGNQARARETNGTRKWEGGSGPISEREGTATDCGGSTTKRHEAASVRPTFSLRGAQKAQKCRVKRLEFAAEGFAMRRTQTDDAGRRGEIRELRMAVAGPDVIPPDVALHSASLIEYT